MPTSSIWRIQSKLNYSKVICHSSIYVLCRLLNISLKFFLPLRFSTHSFLPCHCLLLLLCFDIIFLTLFSTPSSSTSFRSLFPQLFSPHFPQLFSPSSSSSAFRRLLHILFAAFFHIFLFVLFSSTSLCSLLPQSLFAVLFLNLFSPSCSSTSFRLFLPHLFSPSSSSNTFCRLLPQSVSAVLFLNLIPCLLLQLFAVFSSTFFRCLLLHLLFGVSILDFFSVLAFLPIFLRLILLLL